MNDKGDAITKAQYTSINALIADVESRYKIKYVLGHSDIAPGRKSDPWGIDWGRVKK